MATLGDIGVAAAINLLSAFVFLLAFAILRLQPFNDRMPEALKMPELELIEHAGLYSAVYLRVYLIGLKIFVPIAFLAWAVLVPVNYTNKTLELQQKNVTSSDIDKLSISNIPLGSDRFCDGLCFYLLDMLCVAKGVRDGCIYEVLVRNVPPDPDESVVSLWSIFSWSITRITILHISFALYFLISIFSPYQTGFLGLGGKKLDAIDYHISEIEKLSKELKREKLKNDPKSIMPAAFVYFKSRWGAAVCAQTQQSRNPTLWLTEWALEPRDVYWQNLAIPFVSLVVRRLIMAVAFFFLTSFFMIPIASVQALASLEGLEKAAPFLKP
ncbi:hypothetical protein DITRI_Ditri02bG0008600 [Diplodiscus trichospermus]